MTVRSLCKRSGPCVRCQVLVMAVGLKENKRIVSVWTRVF